MSHDPAISPPVVLTVAGSDSSCGAGLQADLKTFAAHRVYGVCATTALVAEVPGEVSRIVPVEGSYLALQLAKLAGTFPLAAAKTGMLATAELVEETAAFFRGRPRLAVVVDPVIRASTGVPLLDASGLEALKTHLLPIAKLATPNLPEAETLLGRRIESEADFAEAPRRFHERFGCDVLVKGGHFRGGGEVRDRAWISGESLVLSRPRLSVPDVHGTGCTLSAAIAARLALGAAPPDAVAGAAAYLAESLASHFSWPRGVGAGGGIEALNHFPPRVE